MSSPFEKPPLYVVPFTPGAAEGRAQDQSAYAPVLFERPEAVESTVPHGLAKTVATALPGLWYCLHLPAALSDLIDVDIWMLKAAQNLSLEHNILLVPIDCFDEDVLGRHLQYHHPVVTICPDELLDEARQRASTLGFALPTTPYSQLSDATLTAQWKAVHEHFIPDLPRLTGEVPLTHRLDLAPLTLPHRRLARQMGWPTAESVVQDTSASEAFAQALRGQTFLAALTRLEREGASHDEADRRFRQTFEEEATRLRVPVALALPGTAPAYARIAYDSELRRRTGPQSAVNPNDTWSVTLHERPDHMVERAAIEFAVTHQSVASSGLGLMLPTMPPDAFITLAELERHFHTPHSSAAVRRLLTRLNDAAQPLWSKELKAAIQRASYLTVFSDFPLGLLTMPGDSAPLCARLPVMYRPLQPLTRMVQQQLSAPPAMSLDRSIKVLVAECIPVSDPVGRMSRQGWDIARETVAPDSVTLTIIQAETLTLEALRQSVAEHRPDILIISAHGTMVGNMAALVVGDAPHLDLGLDRMPPVVILSACHVAPRGSGTVAITDLLLREGALAVLGTQVPVDVRRNAMLMVRFMVYLAKENTKPGQFSTILDVWHHVQTSNAVNDIIDGSPSLRAWGTSTTINGRPVLVEFMSSRAVGRIRPPHVYEDTERVLGEIADEQGQGDRVRNWFRRPGYVPESLFYIFAGRPDRIHLTPLELLTEQACPGR
ncbi:CHAT domain-containing protein [Streptomyces sp. CA-210063]|uniref:CHAT domain-containing protein n=1 Tax=Streptomyces sp. CA-210063 TaxID=2801029 RepID=UPI00214B4A60|nr:CHAT domain-containing protein [Streptomyces sp. CA-210063]UUU36779.1 CHAT domain-containing protein [Streptomyces sp. CA-210063]